MRVRYAGAAVFSILVLASPAGAQTSEMPTELWSQYPLVQKVERAKSTAQSAAEPSAIGPLLPPVDPEAAPASGASTRWGVWLAALALGFVTLLFVARTVPPVAASGVRAVGGGVRRLRSSAAPRARTRKPKPLQLREAPAQPREAPDQVLPAPAQLRDAPVQLPPAPASGRPAQYAPLPPVAVAEPDVEREPRRSVMRRTGLLRSRFVVVADEPGGKVRRVARSRSFWRVGGVARRERAADDAWSDLVNDLRAAGWEPDSPRSDYYVLLRRVDSGTSSILPTLEAYTLVSDDSDRN
jgi:hypothetical protein